MEKAISRSEREELEQLRAEVARRREADHALHPDMEPGFHVGSVVYCTAWPDQGPYRITGRSIDADGERSYLLGQKVTERIEPVRPQDGGRAYYLHDETVTMEDLHAKGWVAESQLSAHHEDQLSAGRETSSGHPPLRITESSELVQRTDG